MIQKNPSTTALLVFSLSAGREAERKALFGNHNKNTSTQFFKMLIDETAKTSSSAGVDVIWVDEKKQRGFDFGSRFTHAFQEVFAKGYDNIISIGNDCPDLTIDRLKTAIIELEQQKIVLGPSRDGGVYLLGMNKAQFDAGSFQRLPWQQDDLFETLKLQGSITSTPCFCLDLLQDIDSREDLEVFIKNSPEHSLVNIFKEFINATHTLFFAFKDHLQIFRIPTLLALRAPPTIQIAA